MVKDIKQFRHENVRPNGTFEDRQGSVITKGDIRISATHGGCDLEGCTCSEGHWVSVIYPRTPSGVVEGETYFFNTREDLWKYISRNSLTN